jgi:hypothetical protein
MSKREYYLKAKRRGYRGELKWIGSTTAEWKEVCEELERRPEQYSFDLQYLFDCYPIRKRLVKYLKAADLYVLQYTTRGITHIKKKPSNLVGYWARHNNFNVLKWARSQGCAINDKVYRDAAESRNIEMVEWLLSLGIKPTRGSLGSAVVCGDMAMLDWLMDPQKGIQEWGKYCSLVDIAAMHKQKEMVETLLERGCPTDGLTQSHLLKKGYEKALATAVERYGGWSEYAVAGAVESGDFELAKEIYAKCDKKAYTRSCSCAAKINSLEMMEWLYNIGYELCHFTMEYAIEWGNIEMLEWMHSKGFKVHYSAIVHAAKHGHENIIKWLLEKYPKKCRLNEKTMAYSLYNGELYISKRLRALGCDWGMKVYRRAIRIRSKEHLDWLIKNGCPYDYDACLEKAKKRRKCYEWFTYYYGKK